MHVHDIGRIDDRLVKHRFRLSEELLRRSVVSEINVVSGTAAQLTQDASRFGRIAIVKDGGNQIPVVAIVAGDGDHREALLTADDLEIVGQELAMTNAAPIDSFEDILFDLKFGSV